MSDGRDTFRRETEEQRLVRFRSILRRRGQAAEESDNLTWNRLWTCPRRRNMSQSDFGFTVVHPVFSSLGRMAEDSRDGCRECDAAADCSGPVEYAPIRDRLATNDDGWEP